jgi:mannose-6-phosphate isomerase-like protein (cupin superfamily)
MYYVPYSYPYSYSNPYYLNMPMYNVQRYPVYGGYQNELEYANHYRYWQSLNRERNIEIKDYGKEPFVVNINEATKQNNTFRTALWTGSHLQVTLMSINVGEDIGLENHPNTDQFLRVEEGQGIVQMGDTQDNLFFQAQVSDDFAILIPAGKWHNVTNTGNTPLKLYSIYAPPEHPFGTVHRTKAEVMAAEEHHG